MELNNVLDTTSRPNWSNMSVNEILRYMAKNGHCSALIKVSDDLSQLWSGHTSWFMYSFSLRLLKHYDMPLAPGAAARRISMSSYPGALASIDDFYLTDRFVFIVKCSSFNIDKRLLVQRSECDGDITFNCKSHSFMFPVIQQLSGCTKFFFFFFFLEC